MARTTKYYHMMRQENELMRSLLDDISDAGLIPPAWAKRLEKARSLKPSGKQGRPKMQARKNHGNTTED